MEIKYKNTNVNFRFVKTTDETGIREGNYWISVESAIKNDEINYKGISSECTLEELIEFRNFLHKLCNNEITFDMKMTFIKNYETFSYDVNNKILTQNIYLYKDEVNKYYTLKYDFDEIPMFYDLINEAVKNME